MIEENNVLLPDKNNWKTKLKQPKVILSIISGIIILTALIVSVVLLLSREESQPSVIKQDKISEEKKAIMLKLSETDKKVFAKIDNVFSSQQVASTTRQGKAVETMYYFKHNYHSLSTEAQTAIKPYLLRPNDVNSYLHSVYSQEVKNEGISFIDTAHAKDKRPAYSQFIITADDRIKVWYPQITVVSGGTSKKVNLYEVEAKKVVAAFNENKAYTKFKQLLGTDAPSDKGLGGDDRIDLYLVNKYNPLLKIGAGFNADGVVISDVAYSKDKGAALSSFIVLNSELNDKDIKTVAVHELFHIFQDNYEGPGLYEYSADKDAWWMEATAKWSEHYIYPNLNSEQSNLAQFIQNPDLKLTKYDHDHEYGAYIFPYYLVQNYGTKIIKDIFDDSISGISALQSIEQEVTFLKGTLKGTFSDFWIWNYNQGAARLYSDPGGFISFSTELSNSLSQLFTKGDALASLSTNPLQPLTSQVVKIYISSKTPKGKNIEKVRVDYSNFTGKSVEAGVQALIYTRDGNSYLEDWNGKTYREFNLKKGGKDDAIIVVLVLANVDKKSTIGKSNIVVTSVEEKEEEKPLSEYYINQTDRSTGKSYLNTTGSSNTTVVSTGKMVGSGLSSKYPYIGKWKVDYNLKSSADAICGSMSHTCISSFEFDLSEAYIFALELGKASFTVKPGSYIEKDNPSETCCNFLGAQLCENNSLNWCEINSTITGYLSDITENGAKVTLDWGGYTDERGNSLVLQIKKK